MENKCRETPPSIHVDSSGAAATTGGVAAGAGGYAARRDINFNNVHNDTKVYLSLRVDHNKDFLREPSQPWDPIREGPIEVDTLRHRLLKMDPIAELTMSKTITVRGTLYPCALLSSGWWERQAKDKTTEPKWKNNVQAWLFHGFHDWGPSWNFTWDFESGETDTGKPYFVAQLGAGDESNSIPVIVPRDKARKLREKFLGRGGELKVSFGGLDVEVTGLLCHRLHFPEAASVGLLGDILDYCIWINEDDKDHKLSLCRCETDIYAGYLWKCLAPRDWVKENEPLGLNQVYFVWEHTNLLDKDAINYNLDSLERKESYITKQLKHRDLILLQKSSLLVPGKAKWSSQEFYNFLVGKVGEDI